MFRSTTRTICFLSAAFCTGITHAIDLQDAFLQARNSDPVFKTEQLDLKAAGYQPDQARAALRPSVTGNASASRIYEGLGFSGSRISTDSIGLTLRQPLYNPTGLVALQQAKRRVSAAELKFADAEQSLIIRTAQAYFGVLAALDNLDLAEAEQTAIKRQLELAEERLEVGLGIQTDLFDAQARFQLAEAEVISAENFIENTRQVLAEIIGSAPQQYDRLKIDTPLHRPQPDSITDWTSRAVESNLAIRQQILAVEIANMEVDLQKKGRWPTLDLSLAHNRNAGIRDSESTDLSLQLRLPLYSGGSINTGSDVAVERFKQSQEVLESQRRSAQRESRAAFRDVTSSINRVDALKQAVRASESSVEAKEEGFTAGLTTNIDVLDAQRDLFRAKKDYLQARYDYILNTLELEQVAGSLAEKDIKRVNKWLQ
ncbi:MAG: TolC family outer membrane protein [Arenicellales bacterium WSBS_2016_MAG_OTU3]